MITGAAILEREAGFIKEAEKMSRNRSNITHAVAWVILSFVAPVELFAGGLVDTQREPAVVAPSPATTVAENFYVGGALGYAFGGDDRVGILQADPPRLTFGTLVNEGPTGSIFAGWRQSTGQFGWGAEAQFLAGGVDSDVTGDGYTAEMSLDGAASLRLLGSVAVSSRTSLYGFGGVAYGAFGYRVDGEGQVGPAAIDENLQEFGYAVGLGIEYAINSNWSARLDYQYMNFGRMTVRDASGLETEATPDFNHVQLGVSYSF